MIDKDIDEIEIKDIENLVEQQQPEGKRFEFKKEYNSNKDSDASKLLEEIVSFANGRGGDLILGLDEVDG